LLARQQVRHVEAGLRRVQFLVSAGRLAEARQVAATIPAATHRAQLLTSGPAWWLAAHVPYLGAPAETVRGATDAAHRLGAQGIPALLDVARLMDPSRLRTGGATLDLTALESARPRLEQAAQTLHAAQREVDGLPGRTWLHAVDTPRAQLADALDRFTGYVDAATRAARVLPPMLGADGPKRYFIGMQNEAELRGTGGLPGAFAIAVASHGTVRFTHFESDAALLPAATDKQIATGLGFGREFTDAYGASLPTQSYPNSNVSPDFPYAARIWARMWQQVSGEHVDGALAVDPTVLGYLLSATGPVRLPDGRTLSATNVVSLTERDEYALYPDYGSRKQFLVAVLHASADALTSGRGSSTALARAMVQASAQRRLLVWSADPDVQRELAATTYGGVIPRNLRPFAAPILNNTSGGKLDYYLQRAIEYRRSGCGPIRDVRVTLRLTNTAPAAGLPGYVTTRLDRAPPSSLPGDYATLLDYYATAGAQLLSVRVDGTPVTAAALAASGHPVFRLPVQLPRGTTVVELHLVEPAGSGAPLLWLQPGVTEPVVTFASQTC
jgi:hypothetical protein